MALNIQMSQKQTNGEYEYVNPSTVDGNIKLSTNILNKFGLSSGSNLSDGFDYLNPLVGEIVLKSYLGFENEDTRYLYCDGSSIDATDYPDLVNYLNSTSGVYYLPNYSKTRSVWFAYIKALETDS